MERKNRKVKMTVEWIEELEPPENGRVEYTDCGRAGLKGLALRHTSSGLMSWIFSYRIEEDGIKKPRRVHLGAQRSFSASPCP